MSIGENLKQTQDEMMLSAFMRKSLEGNSESYRQLLRKVKELMTPFVSNTLIKYGLSAGGGHEDVVQEILLGVHLKRATFDPLQPFLPWMYAIARYKTIDYLRRNKVTFRTVSLEDSFEAFEMSETLEFGAGLDLETLCEKLPRKQRDLLLMVKVDGLSMSEAALRTGFSVSDVKVSIHRAIKELTKQVKDADDEN